MRLALLLLLSATACQQAPKPTPTATTPSALASSHASPAVPAPAKPWFEGAWQGAFRAELFRIELSVGGVKEWQQDDGKQASGEGTLALQAAADGTVTGSAHGALGDLSVAGRADGDRVALTLSAADASGFHGLILASQTPEGMKGTLNASSGDSLQARQASVTLTRATP